MKCFEVYLAFGFYLKSLNKLIKVSINYKTEATILSRKSDPHKKIDNLSVNFIFGFILNYKSILLSSHHKLEPTARVFCFI